MFCSSHQLIKRKKTNFFLFFFLFTRCARLKFKVSKQILSLFFFIHLASVFALWLVCVLHTHTLCTWAISKSIFIIFYFLCMCVHNIWSIIDRPSSFLCVLWIVIHIWNALNESYGLYLMMLFGVCVYAHLDFRTVRLLFCLHFCVFEFSSLCFF